MTLHVHPFPYKPKHPPTHTCMRLLNPLQPAPVCQCQRKDPCHCLSLPQRTRPSTNPRLCASASTKGKSMPLQALLTLLLLAAPSTNPPLSASARGRIRAAALLFCLLPLPSAPQPLHPAPVCQCKWTDRCCWHTYPCPLQAKAITNPHLYASARGRMTTLQTPLSLPAASRTIHQPAPVCQCKREDPCCRAAVLRSVGLALKAVA